MGRGSSGANRQGRVVSAQRRNTGNFMTGFGIPASVVPAGGQRVQPTVQEQNRARIEALRPTSRPQPAQTRSFVPRPEPQTIRNETLPDGTRVVETAERVTYDYTIDGNRAQLYVSKPMNGYPGSVGFTVNEWYTTTGTRIDPGTGRSIMMRAIRSWRDHVKSTPEGSIYRVTAAEGDSRVVRGRTVDGGEERAKFYQSMGFSEPTGSSRIQSSIKRDGKMVPYTAPPRRY